MNTGDTPNRGVNCIPTALLNDEIENLVRRHWDARFRRSVEDKEKAKSVSAEMPALIDIREYLPDAAICGGLTDHLVARWLYDGSAVLSIDFGLNPNAQSGIFDIAPVDIVNFGIDNETKRVRVHILELNGHLTDSEYAVEFDSVDSTKKWTCIKREEWMVRCQFYLIFCPSDIWCKKRWQWDEYNMTITSRVWRALRRALGWRVD
jgi:hypothetical protein